MSKVLPGVYSAGPALAFLGARSKLLHLSKKLENILSATRDILLDYR